MIRFNLAMVNARPIQFTYTNYRGETCNRVVTPIAIEFFSNEYYPEPQWLLRCFCHDRLAERSFALAQMKDVKLVEENLPPPPQTS